MAKLNKVCVNLVQDFTNTEKQQARDNIGAGTGNGNSTIRFSNVIGKPDISDANMEITKERHNLPATGEHYDMKVTNAQGNTQTFALAPTNLSAGIMVMSNSYISTISTDSLKDFEFVTYGTSTFMKIKNLVDAGKTKIILLRDGIIGGVYRYSTTSNHVFKDFYSDPVRGMEYFCDDQDVWTYHTTYASDIRSIPQYCYYRETLGWNGKQATVADNPEWNLWANTATWYNKNDTAQAAGTTMHDLLRSYANTRVAKYGISETIQLECDAVVNTAVHINARLSLKYYYRQNNTYSFFDVPWYEGQIYGFTGFRDISTATAIRSLSQPLQLNAVVDMSQSFWKNYVNNQNITDFGFVFALKLLTSNVPSSVSTVWLCTAGKRESLSLMY